MFCSECGTESEDGARYCSSCGRLLGDAPNGGPREVASGGEPGLSWAGRGSAQAAPARAGAELTTLPGPDGATVELAGFWIRFGGLAIDAAAWWGLVMVAWLIAFGMYFAANGMPDPAVAQAELIPAEDLNRLSIRVQFTTWGIVFLATWWFNSVGWTPGKRAVGLRIVRADGMRPGMGRGIGRTLGAWLSWLPLGLGFLWAAWDKQHQTWHDKMTETYVVRANSLREHHDHQVARETLQ
jgi:uncharacterized RDD family membrane protein YckC